MAHLHMLLNFVAHLEFFVLVMMAHLNMLLNVVATLELFVAHDGSFEHVVECCGSLGAL
jgi:hypothetical protein